MASLLTIDSGQKIGVHGPAKVWGQVDSTSEQLLIHPEARDVVCNGTVDRLDFAGSVKDHLFMTRSGQLFILNAREELLARFLFNSDNPLTLAFADGAVQASYDSATREIFLGGELIGSTIAPWSGTRIDTSRTSDVGAEIEPVPTLDTSAPVVQKAIVNGSVLKVSFDENLDSTTLPSASAFTILVDGVQIPVSIFDQAGSILLLTLEKAVQAGQLVSVTYAAPSSGDDAGAIRDTAGNEAVGFTLNAVNQTKAEPGTDMNEPVVTGAEVDGRILSVFFDEALNTAALPPISAFAVLVDGEQVAVSDCRAFDSTLTLTLQNPVLVGQTVRVKYTDPSSGNDANAIQDAAGNDTDTFTLGVVNETEGSRIDVKAPAATSATVRGRELEIRLDETLNTAALPPISAFAVLVDGEQVAVSNCRASDSTLTLTLQNAVLAGQTVRVTYTDPSSGNDANAIQDATGNDAATFTLNVTNLLVENALTLGGIPTEATVTQSGIPTPLDDIFISGVAPDTMLVVILSLGNADFGILETTAGSSGARMFNSGDDLHTIIGTMADINSILAGLSLTSSNLGAACLDIEVSVSDGSKSVSGQYAFRQQIPLNTPISLEGFGNHTAFPERHKISLFEADGGDLSIPNASSVGDKKILDDYTDAADFAEHMTESIFTPTELGEAQIRFEVGLETEQEQSYGGVYLFEVTGSDSVNLF